MGMPQNAQIPMGKENRLPLSKSIPIPFKMCSPTRVQIALEDLWDVAREWARLHGYRKQEGAFQGVPAFLCS